MEVVQMGERKAATKEEWDMRKGASRSGWQVNRGMEMEGRIEERHGPPRYENPPDVLPNPNNESFNRSVRFKPIRKIREGLSASQHNQRANRHDDTHGSAEKDDCEFY